MENLTDIEQGIHTPKSLQQPKGLYVLFFTELWERYGFYTVQTLLVLFLTKAFLFTDQQAYGLFGAFGALIYATPVIGGYLADKFLGFRKAIFFGGVLFIIGYLGLAFFYKTHWFYLALSFLICGNGFFKSCVSSLLGELYQKNDIRRESGFTLFYMGINVGSFSASIIGAWIAVTYGWNYAFGMAAVGMCLGMFTLAYGKKFLDKQGLPPCHQSLKTKRWFRINIEQLVYLVTIAVIIAVSVLLQFYNIISWGMVLFSLGIIIYLLYTATKLEKPHFNRMIALIIMLIFSVFFWALFFQMFTSTTLFIERVVNRHIHGWTIPTAMFQALEPISVILLSPILSKVWLSLAQKNKNPSTPMKFAMGILFVALGFLSIPFSIMVSPSHSNIMWIWIVLLFVLLTLGELFLSPVGLSMITVLAPPRLTGMLMGVWFLTLGAATAIASKIANFAAIPKNLTEPTQIAQIYAHTFMQFGSIGILVAVILMLMIPWIKRLAQ